MADIDGSFDVDTSKSQQSFKDLNKELKNVLGSLSDLTKKFGDLDKIDLKNITSQLSALSSIDIQKKTALADNSKTRAEARKTSAEAAKMKAEADNYDEYLQMLQEKNKAYVESVSKQVDAATKKRLTEADIELKTATAEVKKLQAESMRERTRYTGGFYGASAYTVSGIGQRLRNRHGAVGLAARFGERLGEDQDSWFGKTFGKGGKINNAFGGLLAKGTKDGLGVNAGATALGGFITALGMATSATKKFVDSSLEAYGKMEKLSVNMEVVYGSRSQSNEAFGKIQQYATKSPFGVAQTTEMAVLLKQSGVYASELQSTLEMIGDVSSGNEEKMKRIANNYAQIQAIGKASMLDMRQFAYAGLPIYEEVAKNLQVSQKELRRMIGDGEVTAEIIEQAFKNMTSEGGMFYKSVNKGSQTMAARQINLEDIKNISLSEWGKSLWQMGPGDASFGKTFLSIKEDIWDAIGQLGKNWNINQDFDKALNDSKYLANLEKAYQKALASNNIPQAEALKKAISNAHGIGINEDTISSAYISKLMNDLGYSNLNVISESEYSKLEEYLRQLVQDYGSYGNAEYNPWGPGVWNQQDLLKGNFNRDINYKELFSFTDSTMESLFEEATEQLRSSISQSRLVNEMIKLSRTTEDADKALYWLQKNITDTANTTSDAMNKIARGSNSLTSLTEMYKERWYSSPEGKQAKAAQEKNDYQAYVERYNRMNSIYDKKYNRIDTNKMLTKALLEEMYSAGTGFFTTKPFAPTKEELLKRQGGSEWQKLNSNITNAVQQLKVAGVIETDEQKDILKKLTELSNIILQGNRQGLAYGGEKGFATYERKINEIESLVYNQSSDLIKNIFGNIFTDKEAISEIGKFVSENGGKLFVPLWKRVIAGATGWDVDSISSQSGFMKSYSLYANQQIARGGIHGLASSGMSATQLGTLLSYNSNRNAQGVREVNWQNTIANIYKYATSLETSSKQSAAALAGLSNSINNQISVYEKLTADIYSVGEDWATINSVMKGEFSDMKAGSYTWRNILDTAFEASGPASNLFSLSTDEQKGIVITDKNTGEIIGSLDELKSSTDSNTSEMNDFIKQIRVSDIIEMIDIANGEMRNLSSIVSISNSIAQKTYTLDQQIKQIRAEAWGGSYGAFGSIKGRDLSSGAKEIMNGFFKEFASDIAKLDLGPYSTDKQILEAYKSLTGSEDGLDTSQIEAIRAAIDSYNKADYLGQAEAMKTLIEAFGIEMSKLIDKAEEAASAGIDKEHMDAATKILSESHSFRDVMKDNMTLQSGNTWFQQSIMGTLGMPKGSFRDLSNAMTLQGIADPESELYQKYAEKAGGEESLQDKINKYHELREAYEEYLKSGEKEEANRSLEESKKLLDEIGGSINQATLAATTFGKRISDLSKSLKSTFETFTSQAVSSSFETWGKAIGEGADASEALQENFTKLGAGLMSNLGTMITEAGLSMAIHATDMGGVMAGLGLAAVGGAASWLGGFLSADTKKKDKDDKESQKLENLKNDLANLLEQARTDALYYENNLRHQTALGANKGFAYKSVNDAIITPSGQVVETDPKDYLIATKTPQQLVGGAGNVTVQPVINCSVINNSSAQVRTEQTQNADGSIDVITMIEEIAGGYIASSRSDEAFASRDFRMSGKQAIM